MTDTNSNVSLGFLLFSYLDIAIIGESTCTDQTLYTVNPFFGVGSQRKDQFQIVTEGTMHVEQEVLVLPRLLVLAVHILHDIQIANLASSMLWS